MIDNRLRKVNPVSVKIFQPERASSVTIEQKKKFQREVMLLSRIQHENIVQVNWVFSYVSPYIKVLSAEISFYFMNSLLGHA